MGRVAACEVFLGSGRRRLPEIRRQVGAVDGADVARNTRGDLRQTVGV